MNGLQRQTVEEGGFVTLSMLSEHFPCEEVLVLEVLTGEEYDLCVSRAEDCQYPYLSQWVKSGWVESYSGVMTKNQGLFNQIIRDWIPDACMLNDIRNLCRSLGRKPIHSEVTHSAEYSISAYREHFGSIGEAIIAAGCGHYPSK